LSGIFLKNQKDCGQAAMTESDNDVTLLMNSLVSAERICIMGNEFSYVTEIIGF